VQYRFTVSIALCKGSLLLCWTHCQQQGNRDSYLFIKLILCPSFILEWWLQGIGKLNITFRKNYL